MPVLFLPQACQLKISFPLSETFSLSSPQPICPPQMEQTPSAEAFKSKKKKKEDLDDMRNEVRNERKEE